MTHTQSIYIDPISFFESRFKMKVPENMEPEFTQAFEKAYSGIKKQGIAQTIWDVFKQTYIMPEQVAFRYMAHQSHTFGDGSKFVSVKIIGNNNEFKVKDGTGETLSEAVVEAFGISGRQITRKKGVVSKSGYSNTPCVIVGVPDCNGQIYYGVGIASQFRTAEVMAATHACGRALYTAQQMRIKPYTKG